MRSGARRAVRRISSPPPPPHYGYRHYGYAQPHYYDYERERRKKRRNDVAKAIALGADIRIAAPDARLSIMEVKWGLVPDMAITQTLPRLVGIDVAKELTFTGRVFSGTEARALGLVTRTSEEPLATALALANEIAYRSPDAVRAAKRLYDETWTSSDASAALVLETELQSSLIGGANQVEAVAAGADNRVPEFTLPQ